VPVTIDTSGFSVGGVTAVLSNVEGMTCQQPCEVGAEAANGQCYISEQTCEFQVVDAAEPFESFETGELAKVTLHCNEPTTSSLCIDPIDAFSPDGFTENPVCGAACVPFECTDCIPGECNNNGRLDAGDPICVARCVLGLVNPSFDCECGADCNCLGGVEVSDTICTVLRNLELFAPDTCETPPGQALTTSFPDESRFVHMRESPLHRAEHVQRKILALRELSAAAVATLGFRATARQGTLEDFRLSRRLKRAGFDMKVIWSDDRTSANVTITSPLVAPIKGMRRGTVVRITASSDTEEVELMNVQYGSKDGVPMEAYR